MRPRSCRIRSDRAADYRGANKHSRGAEDYSGCMSTRTLATWLALVDRLVEQSFAGALEEHGITRMQWRIMTVLAEGPASADRLDTALADLPAYDDDATAAEQLAELVESGWVETAEDYRMSERGRIAHDNLVAVVDELRTRLLADVSPEEEATTIAVLERMARNLGWEAEPAG